MVLRSLRPEDFKILGISTYQLKTKISLTINGKKFNRKKDIPLRFKQKVVNICQEIKENGKDFYVVENVKSYSIWEEITDVSLTNSEQNSTLVKGTESSDIKDKILLNKTIYNHNNLSNNKTVGRTARQNHSHFQTLNNRSSMPEMKVFIRKEEKFAEISPQLMIESENDTSPVMPHRTSVSKVKMVRKYRGVIIEESQNNPSSNVLKPTPSSKVKTVKKYRGVIIEESQNNFSESISSKAPTHVNKTIRKYRGVVIED